MHTGMLSTLPFYCGSTINDVDADVGHWMRIEGARGLRADQAPQQQWLRVGQCGGVSVAPTALRPGLTALIYHTRGKLLL